MAAAAAAAAASTAASAAASAASTIATAAASAPTTPAAAATANSAAAPSTTTAAAAAHADTPSTDAPPPMIGTVRIDTLPQDKRRSKDTVHWKTERAGLKTRRTREGELEVRVDRYSALENVYVSGLHGRDAGAIRERTCDALDELLHTASIEQADIRAIGLRHQLSDNTGGIRAGVTKKGRLVLVDALEQLESRLRGPYSWLAFRPARRAPLDGDCSPPGAWPKMAAVFSAYGWPLGASASAVGNPLLPPPPNRSSAAAACGSGATSAGPARGVPGK